MTPSIPPAIRIDDLHYAYPPAQPGAAPTAVLRGIDLLITRGEFVALVGRVGAGKTTLCLALNGLAPHATGGVFRGNVTVLGANTKQHAVADLARLVGLVFQDPETQLTQMRVEDEVAFGPENLGLPSAEIEARVTWALDAVGLAAYRDRSPLRLSGGEKQRVAIAAMLAMRPQLLVLDEPTANLDPAGKASVFYLLARLARERQIAIVLATQELERVARYAGRVVVLHEGRIGLDGLPADIFRQTERLRAWGIGTPQLAELADLLTQRMGRSYHFLRMGQAYAQLRAAHRVTAEPSVLNQIKIRAVRSGIEASAGFSGQPTQPAKASMPKADPNSYRTQLSASNIQPSPGPAQIVLEHVVFSYPDGTPALRDVSLTVQAGEFVALLGPNGSGKTTLAKHLNGLLKPLRGRVCVEGRETRTARVAELARLVGYVFQNPDHQIFAPTIGEEVAFGPRLQDVPAAVVTQRVADALAPFELAAQLDRPPALLGWGQRRQVALAAVLAAQPRVLILDEPTGGLDARSRQELMAVVTEFQRGGRTVILITHDMRLVAEYAARAVVLAGGRIAFDGTPRALFERRDLLAQAKLATPPVVRLAQRMAPHGLTPAALTCAEFAAAWQALMQGDETSAVTAPARLREDTDGI